MPATAPSLVPKRAYALIPVATLLVLHPLLIHGPSCGQDLAFHLQSWLDAAAQLRHGTLYPHCDITAAWNAGEPRFLFYPPLSWMLGALLTLIVPIALCPTVFIAIALVLSGFTFYKLASQFASPNAALIASTLYLANPYMLFTAFERSALAELLAAAWIPLLLLALLRPAPTDLFSSLRTIRSIAIPLAFLWLTNAPAAVIGTYSAAFLGTLRLLQRFLARHPRHLDRSAAPLNIPEPSSQSSPSQQASSLSSLRLALTYLASAALGLGLPALYLLPAAYERRYVQTAMALLPNMRYQDNFLFTSTADAPHNTVNHTISVIALTLLIATAVLTLLLIGFSLRKRPVIPRQVPSAQPANSEDLGSTPATGSFLTSPLAILPPLTLLIALLLVPASTPIWQHLSNLAYLQFPWRLLILLSPILTLSIALLLDALFFTSELSLPAQDPGTPFVHSFAGEWRSSPAQRMLTTAFTLLLPLALAVPAYRLFHQPPDPTDNPAHLAQLFVTHHGFPPTDEYTPTTADNDPLRSNNPGYWLAASLNDPAPNTTPTAAELNPAVDTDDTPIPDTQTLSTPAPHHFHVHAPTAGYLILNLRDYPNWDITEVDPAGIELYHPAHNLRNDGLTALTLYYPSDYTINITWRRTLDQTLGLVLTVLALIVLAFTFRCRPSNLARSPSKPSPSA